MIGDTGTLVGLLTLGTLAATALLLTLLSDRALGRTLARRPRAPGPRPPISVLRPVKGLDDGFVENLVSLARQHYPRFEILVGAADEHDPALQAAREVAAGVPEITLRVLVCASRDGLNPKVSILRALSAQAQHDHVLVSDSNVRLPQGYLAALADELEDPRVGLVTNLVAGGGEATRGALFENLHLATFVARAQAFARAYLGHACVVGKSMLFRLSDMNRLGGWARVRDVLAEDYVIGNAYQRAGYGVALSPVVITTHNQHWPLPRFVNRHLRWGQMRRRISLPAYLAEPLLNPTPLLLALAGAALVGGGPAGPWVAAAALAGVGARLLADRTVLAQLRGEPPPLRALLWSVPKDLLVAGMWLVAGFRRTIDWRGNVMRIGRGSRLEPARRPGALPSRSTARTAKGTA